MQRRKHYKQYLAKVKRAESRAVAAMGSALQADVIKLLSTSARRKRRTKTVFRNPSKPGQAPHARTGQLKGHIFHEHIRTRAVSHVGWRGAGIYGLYHELGIRYAKAGFQRRPHLLSTLKRHRAKYARIYDRRFKAAMG